MNTIPGHSLTPPCRPNRLYTAFIELPAFTVISFFRECFHGQGVNDGRTEGFSDVIDVALASKAESDACFRGTWVMWYFSIYRHIIYQ